MSLLSKIVKIVFEIKIDNCEGCFYKSSSQIRNDCLRDFYDLIYCIVFSTVIVSYVAAISS